MLTGVIARTASVAADARTASVASATAAIVETAVENTGYKAPIKAQSVYIMRDKITNVVQYVGRTNNPARRQHEHSQDLRKTNLQPLEVKFTDLSKTEARIMEQLLISAYTIDNLTNARREIAVENVLVCAGKMKNIVHIFGSIEEDELLDLMERQ